MYLMMVVKWQAKRRAQTPTATDKKRLPVDGVKYLYIFYVYFIIQEQNQKISRSRINCSLFMFS